MFVCALILGASGAFGSDYGQAGDGNTTEEGGHDAHWLISTEFAACNANHAVSHDFEAVLTFSNGSRPVLLRSPSLQPRVRYRRIGPLYNELAATANYWPAGSERLSPQVPAGMHMPHLRQQPGWM
jgi:hypothetical protein